MLRILLGSGFWRHFFADGEARVVRIPVYFSHSYRRADREVNADFWRIFYDAGFSFTVDPGKTSLYTTALELMMGRSVGFAAVVTFRGEEEMEGAGAAAAIHDARGMLQAVNFGMIRGISDIPRAGGSQPGREPGTSGQTQMRDTWKPAAAAAAAAAAIQLIRLSWPRQPRAGSRP